MRITARLGDTLDYLSKRGNSLADAAGATYGFAAACRTAGAGFSLGAVIDAPIRDGVEVLNTADGWYPAIDSSGATREGAWVAEATKLVDLSKWPTGARLTL